MSSINNVHQQEAALVQVLKDAAARLASVGTTDLAAALQDLRQAADAAKARLEAAAGKARSVFATLAADAGGIATSLSADLFGTPEPQSMTREALAARQRLNDEADRKARESEDRHRARMATAAVEPAPVQQQTAEPAEQVVTVAACSPVEAPARQWPEAPLGDDDDVPAPTAHPADPTPAGPDADDDVDELAGDGWTQTDLTQAAPPQSPPATRQKPAAARKPAARTKRPRDA